MSAPKVIGFIQARLTSTRLPNKVFAKIGRWTVLELMHLRLRRAKHLSSIVFVIPDTRSNDELAEYLAQTLKVPFVRGDEADVLGRFIVAAAAYPADYYVRLTADCPLICPELVDAVVAAALESRAAYASNTNPPTYPDGFDVECISREALRWTDQNVADMRSREHVTFGFNQAKNRPSAFTTRNLAQPGAPCDWMRLTLDTPQDLSVFQKLEAVYGQGLEAMDHQALQAAYASHHLAQINGNLVRNEALKSKEAT